MRTVISLYLYFFGIDTNKLDLDEYDFLFYLEPDFKHNYIFNFCKMFFP